MFTAEIRCRILKKASDQAVEDAVSGLLIAWRRNGQILSEEWPIAASRTEIRAFVSIPERDSLARKHNSEWVTDQLHALAEAGLSRPTHEILGREPGSADPCRCKKRSAYILYTDYLSMESPLRCADCFAPVPRYRIPFTSNCDTREDTVYWQHIYQYCDGLFIGSTVGERFGERELSRLNSALSKLGIECCRRIAAVTKKPCYYYLYRYSGRTKKLEAQRTCPSCDRKWRLAEPWHKRFDFRCDRCRLVSNFAYSLA